MNKRIIIFIVFVLALSVTYVYAEEAVTLDSLIDEALDNNPRLQSAYSEWKAEEYKARHVRGLPDPQASYGYFGESIETRIGPQEHKYGVSQNIPFPGKLGLKGKAQDRRAGMLREQYGVRGREIIKDVKFLFYDIFWVDKAIQITEEEKTIIESLERVAQRKYESNLVSQQDVIRAHVELSKLIDKLFLLKQNRKSLEARANMLLARPRSSQLGKTGDIEIVQFNYELNELHRMADESSQQLIAARLDMERAEYERSLARLDYFPDFTFGFDYIEVGSGHTTQPNDGDDAWMGKVAINVPIWFGKLDAKLKEKKALLESRKKNHKDAENLIDYEVEDLYFKITTYKDIVSLYKTALVPQAEQAFTSAKTGYETGKVDFLTWLDAEKVLLQTRLAYFKGIVDYQKSIAYLERIVGRDL
jgi:outer membrane protein TolC